MGASLGTSLSHSFDWPQNTTDPTSRVITTIKEKETSDYEILLPHEAIRWAMKQVRDVNKVFNPLEPELQWTQEVYATWMTTFFYPFVHGHHELEEKAWIPLLKEIGKVEIKSEDNIHNEHDDIMPRLEKLCHRLDTPFTTPDELKQFKDDMESLLCDVEKHLDTEERDIPAACKDAQMSPETNKKIGEEFFKHMDMAMQKREMPCVLYAMHMWYGSTDEITHFLKTHFGMPFIAFMMMNNSWIPAFYKNTVAPIEALKSGKRPKPQGGWFSVKTAAQVCSPS